MSQRIAGHHAEQLKLFSCWLFGIKIMAGAELSWLKDETTSFLESKGPIKKKKRPLRPHVQKRSSEIKEERGYRYIKCPANFPETLLLEFILWKRSRHTLERALNQTRLRNQAQERWLTRENPYICPYISTLYL